MIESQFGAIEQIERWPAGEIIFREGDPPRGIFVLYSGTIDLVFSGRNGISKSLRTGTPGMIVGLSDAISNQPHDCTAITQTGARIGFVPIDALRRQLEETPQLWLSIAKFLSADVDSCWASMRTLSAAR
jgi:CRP/FNR family transcriptional regulator, cyclic AMP receptor protein